MNIRKSLALCCVLTVLALPLVGASVASAQNILTNPGFETGDFTGWEVYGETGLSVATIEAGNGPTLPGANHAYLANNAEAIGMTLKQSSGADTAAPGNVNWSVDLKLDQADAGGVLFVEVWAEQMGGGIIGGSGLQGPYWAWDWTNVGGSFTAPAGTDFLTIQIMANTGAAIGTNCLARVDNVLIEQPGVVATESLSLGSIKALYR